jgi:hypothetical protein
MTVFQTMALRRSDKQYAIAKIASMPNPPRTKTAIGVYSLFFMLTVLGRGIKVY